METKAAPPPLQRQGSMNGKRPLLVPQKTNLRFDLSHGESDASLSTSELKPKLSQRRLPSNGRLQPLENVNSRGNISVSPEIHIPQTHVTVRERERESESALAETLTGKEKALIERFLDETPSISLSREDSRVVRDRVIEEMARIQQRQQVSESERQRLFQLAFSLDAPKLARRLVAELQDDPPRRVPATEKDEEKDEERTANAFLTNDPLSLTEYESPTASAADHAVDVLGRDHSAATAAAPTEDELFCKAFDEVERIRRRMLQRASTPATPLLANTSTHAAASVPTALDSLPREREREKLKPPLLALPAKKPPLPIVSARDREREKERDREKSATLSPRVDSALNSSLSDSVFSCVSPFLSLSLTPRSAASKASSAPSRTPEDLRMRANMPEDVLATLDELFASDSALGRPHSARHGAHTADERQPVRHAHNAHTQERDLHAHNGKHKQETPSRGFSFHDPFLKAKDERASPRDSEEQQRLLQSVKENLQLIDTQYSDNSLLVEKREREKERDTINASTHNASFEDLNDLISGEYLDKVKQFEQTMHSVPTNKQKPALLIERTDRPLAPLLVSTPQSVTSNSPTPIVNAGSHSKQRQMLAQRRLDKQFSEIILTEENEKEIESHSPRQEEREPRRPVAVTQVPQPLGSKHFSFENDHIDKSSSSSHSLRGLFATSRDRDTSAQRGATSGGVRGSLSLFSSLELLSAQNSPLMRAAQNSGTRQESIASVQRSLHLLQENLARASLSPARRVTLSVSPEREKTNISPRKSPRKSPRRVQDSPEIRQDSVHNAVPFRKAPSLSSLPARSTSGRESERRVVSQSMTVQPFSSAASRFTAVAREREGERERERDRESGARAGGEHALPSVSSSSRPSTRERERETPRTGSTDSSRSGFNAMRSAGGLLFRRDGSSSSTTTKTSSSAAAATRGEDASSRLFALAAALDAGDAMGKLMADLVVNKNKR